MESRTPPILYMIFIAISIISLLEIPSLAPLAQAGNDDQRVFGPDTDPLGIPYKNWTAIWWTRFIEIPADVHPINERGEINFADHQDGPVWIGAGSGGGVAVRIGQIPYGKAFLNCSICVEFSTAEDQSLQTEADLRAAAKSDQDTVTEYWARIDGVDVPTSKIPRVESGVFRPDFPGDDEGGNVFGAPAGPTQAVSDGFWLFVKSETLTPGRHVVEGGGTAVDYTTTAPTSFIEHWRYELTVEEPVFTAFPQAVTLDDESVAFQVNSTSNISNFSFDESEKQVSFKVSEEDDAHGLTSIPIGRLLNGPYVITVDNATANYNSTEDPATIEFTHEYGSHNIAITGTSVVPEFPYSSIFLLVAVISAIVVLGRTRLTRNYKFY